MGVSESRSCLGNNFGSRIFAFRSTSETGQLRKAAESRVGGDMHEKHFPALDFSLLTKHKKLIK